jgi:SET domain
VKTIIKLFEDMRRGVVVAPGRGIIRGDIVMACELLVLSPNDTKAVNLTELQYYTFRFNDTQDCLVLGDGEIFNHADIPNVSYNLEEREGRMMMVFTAMTNLFPGDQLYINYTADTPVNTTSYTGNKPLIV